jgi:hypothetical protein
MCNRLHVKTAIEIPKTGFGWKVFVRRKGILCPVNRYAKSKYNTDPLKGVTWVGSMTSNYGFCFFLKRDEAKRFSKRFLYRRTTTRKIKYTKGLGSHYEFAIDQTIAICKHFKVVDNKEKIIQLNKTKK